LLSLGILQKRNNDSLKNFPNLEHGQEIYKITLEKILMAETKIIKIVIKCTMMSKYQREIRDSQNSS
jgi:hypothetical protein